MINSRDFMYREKVEIIQNSPRSYRQRYAFVTTSDNSVAKKTTFFTSQYLLVLLSFMSSSQIWEQYNFLICKKRV